MKYKYFEIVKCKIINQIDSEEYAASYSNTEQGLVDKNHFLEVVELVKEIWGKCEDSNIPEALLIAALVHDSDRIYPLREVNTKDCPEKYYGYRKGVHSGNTALIFFELNHKDLPIELIRDVCFMILRHERGGDLDKNFNLMNKNDEFTNSYNLNLASNYLYYADKISFFKSNIYEYKKRGMEKLRDKILFSTQDLPVEIKKLVMEMNYSDVEIKNLVQQNLSQ